MLYWPFLSRSVKNKDREEIPEPGPPARPPIPQRIIVVPDPAPPRRPLPPPPDNNFAASRSQQVQQQQQQRNSQHQFKPMVNSKHFLFPFIYKNSLGRFIVFVVRINVSCVFNRNLFHINHLFVFLLHFSINH